MNKQLKFGLNVLQAEYHEQHQKEQKGKVAVVNRDIIESTNNNVIGL